MGTVDKLLDCRRRRAEIEKGGGEEKIKLQHDAGKKTARERVLLLLDEGSFIETDAFASFGTADANAEGVITGYGSVDGRLIFVYAQDVTVIGAALGEMQAKKICKVMDMAAKMGAPIVAMIDSNGLRLKEGLASLAGYGEIFKRNVALSGVIPQITAVMGNAAGAFSFAPALSDFVFMVDGKSEMFMNAQKVIEGVTGDKAEDISSATVHSEKSGSCHFKVSNDDECIAMIRKLISYLPSNNLEDAPYEVASDDINRISEVLTNLIPDNADGEYDVKVAISEIVDLGSFMEVLPDFAKNIVTGFARMNGMTVGIVANNGMLDIKASNKASRFVRFLDAFNIPVITLTDVEGYKECACQELRGLSSHASKLLYAYAEATVPKVNVVLRKAYGAAYLAMCSKHIGADLVLAWPTAEITPLSPEAAANLLYADEIGESNDPILARKEKTQEYRDNDANPFEAAKMGYVDDVIEPDSTRPRIIAALEMLLSKRETAPSKKHGNIPM